MRRLYQVTHADDEFGAMRHHYETRRARPVKTGMIRIVLGIIFTMLFIGAVFWEVR